VELLTTLEAAQRLDLSPRTVAALAQAGKIRCVRMGLKGGSLRFAPEDLEAYVESCRMYGLPDSPRPVNGKVKR
jgi:excisionase family DNA binding protein